ncbi:MAG: histidinol dehydrogenase [Spirochaetes bacterium]|nr:histidinol dehydrogenase [Spirochaetota bacterium]
MKIEDIRDLEKKEIGPYFRDSFVDFPQELKRDVTEIIREVGTRGDDAVVDFTKRFDGIELPVARIAVSKEEIESASRGVEETFREAVAVAIGRVRRFQTHIVRHAVPGDWSFVDELGNRLGERYTPIERVGVYIPGGTAVYPSSLVMTVVPAAVAGVGEITVISPPGSFRSPSVLAAAMVVIQEELGIVLRVFRIGGVQGIAALALGTESVPRVDKIVGPGNIYVACAKKELFGTVDIDMIAGPSEVLIVADGSVDPKLAAIDLLAQAEHDERARALCVVFSMDEALAVQKEMDKLLSEAVRRSTIEKALEDFGRIYIVRDMETAVAVVNEVAPEHLELHLKDPEKIVPKIKNAGAIFIGGETAEAFGDYIAGPSHVLPTAGSARFFSPLSVTSFLKSSSVVEMSKKGVDDLGGYAKTFARLEGLDSHYRSIDVRRER